jgi:hypothetical protein
MTQIRFPLFIALLALPAANAWASDREELQLTTIADGNRGERGGIDIGPIGPSQGDMFVFDQPLVDTQRKDIGSNAGYCMATRVGLRSLCQRTLTMHDGSLVVTGVEVAQGPSVVAVIGATGRYDGFTGEMTSTPNGDGTYTLDFRLHRP